MIGETISRYQILEKLGEGGMGIVYKARDTRLDRLVAIKFLPSHVDASEETKARFLQEARSVAAINHPNVMSIYEIDERDGKSFLVMEYVDGQTLKDRLAATRSGEGVSRRAALEWALEIAKGLKAAHDKGIVHRDIKSENIMFTTAGQVKVMDFGLAKARGNPGITRAGSSLGTLSYMSPEQMQGIPADHRTDIWSFGVLLYEMLTGELPFKAEHDAALLYLITGEDPPVPSALDRRIPNSVDSLVMKLLRKNRADRASHIDEVIDELTRLLSDADGVTAATRKKAIAVLPFNNISPDKESDYFADGLTEELIANLSRLKEMRVLSRTTSMGYRGTGKDIKTIGRELGTRYILEGSVRKFQDNLRITAQLIDVESDEQLWAETYKGQLADVFDIQEQVSKQIVDALMVKLSPTEKVVLTKRSTMNAEAFDCCLRARNFLYRLTKNNVHLAIQLFQRAIELDPRYASAYAGLGEAYATMYQYFEAAEIWLDRAIESSLKALMYDSSLSEAYAALGLAYFDKKSIDEAVTATRKSIELDPENFTAYWILGRIYFATDKESEAIDLFKKTLELNQNFYSARNDLLMAYERLNDHESHRRTLDDLLNFYPTYLSQNPDDARGHMYHAIHLAQVGRREEAKVEGARALELNPGDSLMMYNAACLYSRLGDIKLAVSTLKDAIAAGQQDYEWIKRDTDLEAIREEPEYKELMRGR